MQAFAVAIILALACATSVFAGDAPAELRGKSLVLQWTEKRIQRHVGEPNFYPVAANHDLRVYIANDGRVFTRLTNTTGAGSGKTEQVAGQPAQGELVSRVPDFENRTMLLYLPFRQGGMRKAMIDFDAEYKGCKARVVFAREEGGKPMLAYSPITKKTVEFRSATTANERCSLRPGNVFAGE